MAGSNFPTKRMGLGQGKAYFVQFFKHDWTDQDTIELMNSPNAVGDVFEILGEAIGIADAIWDHYWDTRDDAYIDHVEEWGVVVAVFEVRTSAVPIYTRGSYLSTAAPWNGRKP